MSALVGITLRAVQAQGYDEPREALARDWVGWLEAHGLTPLLLPLAVRDPAEYAAGFSPAGLVLSNGNDVGPEAGGLAPAGPDVDSQRDRGERALLTWALVDRLPVLAVCRGLQLVTAALGGRLERVDGHVGPHDVCAVGALAAAIGPGPHRVNSFHRQAAARDGFPAALEPLVLAGEHVEAARHRSHPLWALQWHPERAGGDDPAARWIVARWLEAVRARAKENRS